MTAGAGVVMSRGSFIISGSYDCTHLTECIVNHAQFNILVNLSYLCQVYWRLWWTCFPKNLTDVPVNLPEAYVQQVRKPTDSLKATSFGCQVVHFVCLLVFTFFL